jgi:hypothetical protein
LDRELTAPAIDQDAQEDSAGPTEVGELVHCCTHRTAGIEHVVHYDNGLTVNARQPGLAHNRARSYGLQIISIEGDVQLAGCEVRALGPIDESLEPVGQLNSASLNPNENQSVGTTAPLDDLTRHARQGAAESAVVE